MLVKYPRTPHLSFSPGFTKDDVILSNHFFENMRVIVTEKLDGECTSFYKNSCHARSTDSKPHPSRTWIKNLWATIRHDIPEGFRICGENLYAKHSIFYEDLESFFYVFSIWNDSECLSWNDSKEFCQLLNLTHVPVLYEGLWDEELIRKLYKPVRENHFMEGFVVRNAEKFDYNDFGKNVAKFVRKGHVQTDEHWMTQEVVPNKLRK